MRQIALGMAVFLAAQPVQADVVHLKGTVLKEGELEHTPISKPSWLRGLHFVGEALETDDRPQILTVLPTDWSGSRFCARITSMTGDYFAMVEFEVPEGLDRPQIADLEFSSDKDVLREITPDNSGVSLEKGACLEQQTEGDTGSYFIANYWNEADRPRLNDDDEAALVMNMNVARADELVARAVLGGGRSLGVTCAKLNDPHALAYNYLCSVAVPVDMLASPELREVAFSYERLYRGRVSDTREAIFYVGAGQ